MARASAVRIVAWSGGDNERMGQCARSCLFLLAVWLGAPASARAETFTGEEFRRAVEAGDINVMRMHAYWLEALTGYLRTAPPDDYFPLSFGVNYRFTPATFELQGTTWDGVAAQLDFQLTWAHALDDGDDARWILPLGLQFQMIGPDVDNPAIKHTALTEVLLFGGIASRHGAMTLALEIDDVTGFDAAGDFCEPPDPGAEPDNPTCGDKEQQHAVLSVYSPHVGTTAVRLRADRTSVVEALRAVVNPMTLELLEPVRRVLTPALGYDYLAPFLDYYGERYEAVRRAADAGELEPEPSRDGTHEVSVSARDIFQLGFEAVLTTQVSPKTSFRSAELSWSGRWGTEWELSAGAAALALARNDEVTPSFEAFTELSLGTVGRRALVGLAYSYDVPGAFPGLALPHAHVLGVQLTLGMPRGLAPISRRAIDAKPLGQ